MSEVKLISKIRVNVDREDVLKLLRFREGTTRVDRRVEKLVSEAIREGNNLIETLAVYRDVKLEARANDVVVDGGSLSLKGASITQHLQGSSRGTILAVTIGRGISARIGELSEAGEMARATILDAFGSEAVEALADIITAQVASKARKEGSSLTARFSPGYGDLSLEHQKGMLKYMEAYRIGILLSKALAMLPEKSITAILGWRRVKK